MIEVGPEPRQDADGDAFENEPLSDAAPDWRVRSATARDGQRTTCRGSFASGRWPGKWSLSPI